MKCVAVVPMKLNNRRMPGKNIKSFTNGEPLCRYILNTLLEIKKIDEIYVYCSDEDIKQYLPNNIKYLARSKDLDQDSTKINEVLLSFSDKIDADIYIMAHVTAPFIKSESITKGINAVMDEGYDSSFSAKKQQDFIWIDEKPYNYSLENIPRTQDLKPYFVETSGFYCYKKEVIQEKNRRIGNKPKIIEVSDIEGIDIDEPEDFLIADAIYNYNTKYTIREGN